MLSSADLFGCQQGENFIKVVNILVFISFQNYNFKNDFPFNLAFVCVLAPTMAPFVEPWEEQKCWQSTELHSSYGKVPL